MRVRTREYCAGVSARPSPPRRTTRSSPPAAVAAADVCAPAASPGPARPSAALSPPSSRNRRRSTAPMGAMLTRVSAAEEAGGDAHRGADGAQAELLRQARLERAGTVERRHGFAVLLGHERLLRF